MKNLGSVLFSVLLLDCYLFMSSDNSTVQIYSKMQALMVLQILEPVDFLEKLGNSSQISIKGHVDNILNPWNLLNNKTPLWMVQCVHVWVGEVEK